MKTSKSPNQNDTSSNQIDGVKNVNKEDKLKKGKLDNLQGGKGHEFTYSKTTGTRMN